MKKIFDFIFYSVILFFIFHILTNDYGKKISDHIDSINLQTKKYSFLQNKIKNIEEENTSLKNRIKNLEFYIYKNKREEENLND